MLLLNRQWQGWGESDRIAHGADRLAAQLAVEIDVVAEAAAFHRLTTEDGILGRAELATQAAQVRSALADSRASGVVAVSGDCGGEVPVIDHLNGVRDGMLSLIWIDAHPDLNTPGTSPSSTFHGMALRALIDPGFPDSELAATAPIAPDRVAFMGTRAIDPPERTFMTRHGLRVTDPSRLEVSGPVYVHVDLDALDPGAFPSVAHPEPDGLSVIAVASVLERLEDTAGVEVVGVGLCESTATDPDELLVLDPLLDVVSAIAARMSDAS